MSSGETAEFHTRENKQAIIDTQLPIHSQYRFFFKGDGVSSTHCKSCRKYCLKKNKPAQATLAESNSYANKWANGGK